MPDTSFAGSEMVLCEGSISVSIGGQGSQAVLYVHDGEQLSFFTGTELLEQVLEGETLQFSADEGFCRIHVEGDRVKLEYGIHGEGRRKCTVELTRFREVLAIIRARRSQE